MSQRSHSQRLTLPLSVLLFGTFAMAGCITIPDADVQDDTPLPIIDEGPRILEWGYTDCAAAIAIVDVPASKVAPHLPEGFTPMTLAEANGPPGVRGDAAFGVEVLSCADGIGADGNATGATVYGAYWTFVHPPADLVDEESTFHFYKWDTAIQDAGLREILVDAGLPARSVTTEFSTPPLFAQTPVGPGAFQQGFGWDGETTHVVSVTGASSAVPFGNEDIWFTEFSEGTHGIVEWRTRALSTMYISSGYVRVPAEGIPADVIGEERTPALIIAGSMSFTEGTITLPGTANTTMEIVAVETASAL